MNYGDFWSRVVWPVYERFRGKQTPQIEAGLAKSQFEPIRDIRKRQAAGLAALLEHAQKSVPFYRQWFAENGVSPAEIAESGDLSALPLVDKQMIMAQPELFHSDPQPPGSYTKATGGSTGRPLRLRLDPLSDQWRNAVYRRGYAWASCREGDRQVYLWGADVMPVSRFFRLRRGLFRAMARMRFYSSFGLGAQEMDEVLTAIGRFRPKCLVGYTTALEALARRALATGWAPPPQLQSVISGAEALHQQQRESIEEAMRCPVFETYGSREFMLIAAECPEHNGLHISAENLIVEVLKDGKPAPAGQLGEIVITDLHNFAQPFIRYRSGDLASMAEGDCPCGRSLPRLERIEGRILDMIVSPDGRVLPGEFFPHFFKDLPKISQFQVRQTAADNLSISVVALAPLNESDRNAITQATARVLPGVHVDIFEVEDIPVTAAGKRRVTIGLEQESDK